MILLNIYTKAKITNSRGAPGQLPVLRLQVEVVLLAVLDLGSELAIPLLQLLAEFGRLG
jgi:hypothetical protein